MLLSVDGVSHPPLTKLWLLFIVQLYLSFLCWLGRHTNRYYLFFYLIYWEIIEACLNRLSESIQPKESLTWQDFSSKELIWLNGVYIFMTNKAILFLIESFWYLLMCIKGEKYRETEWLQQIGTLLHIWDTN